MEILLDYKKKMKQIDYNLNKVCQFMENQIILFNKKDHFQLFWHQSQLIKLDMINYKYKKLSMKEIEEIKFRLAKKGVAIPV